jgi:glucosamine-6-phosphate deaminase
MNDSEVRPATPQGLDPGLPSGLHLHCAVAMRVRVFAEEGALSRAAVAQASQVMAQAIAARGKTRIVVAGDESQGGVLKALAQAPGIAWSLTELFHDAEYVGLHAEHPASRRRFLCDQLIAKTRIGRTHLLDGQREPDRVCRDEGEALRAAPIDLAFASIGPNGEVALNYPPADFFIEKPYLVIGLDEASRRENVGKRGIHSFADAPDRAIAISIRQLLQAVALIVCVPGAARAGAVKRCVEGAVSPLAPASILQTHADVTLYLDCHSAALLTQRPEPEE